MDQTTAEPPTPTVNPAAAPQLPQTDRPVMDVVPPRPQEATPNPGTEKPAEARSADIAVQVEPVQQSTAQSTTTVAESPDSLIEAETKHQAAPASHPQPKPTKPPKTTDNSVAIAIAATVVIVLALSVLAVLAYTTGK